jgi:mannose-6-phosphate isomerase-like protein (cupin superfamily)
VFVALRGRARISIDGGQVELAAGDAFVVPAGTTFTLANPHPEAFEAVAALPVGGRARMPGGEPFTPPWAE